MRPKDTLSRRSFLAAAATTPLAAYAARRRFSIGLELYSVRNEIQKDLKGTVIAVAKQGYEVFEIHSMYYGWTPEYAKEVRKLLDDLGVRMLSTHNGANAFAPENLDKTIELNGILGCRYVIMASAGRVQGVDGWKGVAERLNQAAEKFKSAKMRPGYHNHQLEFKAEGGVRPIDVIAQNTGKSVVLQLDVGTCVEVGQDPVAWIQKNPGRFACIHLKDYSPEPGKGYRVVFGEGAAPWKEIFKVVEETGGLEYYLIEQEGSDYPPIETAQRCLANFKKLHG